MSLIQRILSTLTHQTVVHDVDDESEVADNYIPFRTANDFIRMKTSHAEKLTAFFISLVELNHKNLCECRQNWVKYLGTLFVISGFEKCALDVNLVSR